MKALIGFTAMLLFAVIISAMAFNTGPPVVKETNELVLNTANVRTAVSTISSISFLKRTGTIDIVLCQNSTDMMTKVDRQITLIAATTVPPHPEMIAIVTHAQWSMTTAPPMTMSAIYDNASSTMIGQGKTTKPEGVFSPPMKTYMVNNLALYPAGMQTALNSIAAATMCDASMVRQTYSMNDREALGANDRNPDSYLETGSEGTGHDIVLNLWSVFGPVAIVQVDSSPPQYALNNTA